MTDCGKSALSSRATVDLPMPKAPLINTNMALAHDQQLIFGRAQIISPKDGRAFCSGQVCDNIDRVMAQIRLVCWKEELAAERARALKKLGLDVDASPFHPGG